MDVIFQEFIRLIYSEKVYFFIKLVSLKPRAIYCFGLFCWCSYKLYQEFSCILFLSKKKDTFDYKVKRVKYEK